MVSAADELKRRVADYPRSAQAFFERAFDVSATIPEEKRITVFEEVITALRRGGRKFDGVELGRVSALSPKEAESLASVYSLVIGLMSDTLATSDDFVSAAKGTLFSQAQESIARSIAETVCDARSRIEGLVERAQLAGEILPSLVSVGVVVDLRFRIIDRSIKYSIPVAIVHIDTDVESEALFLQLTRGDIEDLIAKLSRSLEEMKIVESLAEKVN